MSSIKNNNEQQHRQRLLEKGILKQILSHSEKVTQQENDELKEILTKKNKRSKSESKIQRQRVREEQEKQRQHERNK